MRRILLLLFMLAIAGAPALDARAGNCFDRLDERNANRLKDRQEEAKKQGLPIPTATPTDAKQKCAKPPKNGPPPCDACPSENAPGSSCELVDLISQARKLHELYQTGWIRAAAARHQSSYHENGLAMLQCLVQEEFDAWLQDGYESACKKGDSGAGGAPTSAPVAWVDPDTCKLNCADEVRKTYCKPIADAFLAHEENHQVWCKGGKGDASRDCNEEFMGSHRKQGHGDVKRFKACNRAVIDAIANDEATAYDVGGTKLRASLAELRLKCGTSTSNDDLILLSSDQDEVLLHDAYEILRIERWTP